MIFASVFVLNELSTYPFNLGDIQPFLRTFLGFKTYKVVLTSGNGISSIIAIILSKGIKRRSVLRQAEHIFVVSPISNKFCTLIFNILTIYLSRKAVTTHNTQEQQSIFFNVAVPVIVIFGLIP